MCLCPVKAADGTPCEFDFNKFVVIMLSILILLLIIPSFVQMLDRRGVFVRLVIFVGGVLVLVFEFIIRDTNVPVGI